MIDADEGDADNTGTLIVALLQKERRLKRTEGCELLTMGYAIYKVSYCQPHSTNSEARAPEHGCIIGNNLQNAISKSI